MSFGRGFALRIAGAVGVLGSAAWSFWPLPNTRVALPDAPPAAQAPVRAAAPRLNLAAFRTPLWVAPPPPPQAAAPPPPPPPLRLRLVAILSEQAGYRAAVYDPDADRLLIIGAGDSIAGRAVLSVRASDLTLGDASGQRQLTLQTEGAAP